MAKGKQPYIPLYIGDWEQDTNCLTLESEAAWLKLVFKLWSSKPRGLLEICYDQLSILFKNSPEKTRKILQELIKNNVFDHEILQNGDIKIISRRMVKECAISEARAASGKKGGIAKAKRKQNLSKTLANIKQIPEYDIDIINDNIIDNKKGVQGKKKI